MNKISNCYFGGSGASLNIGNGVTALKPQMLQIIGCNFHEVDGIAVYLTTPTQGNVVANNTFWAGDPKQNDATNLIPGNQDIYIDHVDFGSSGTVICNNVFNRFLGPVEPGPEQMPGVGKSNAIEVQTYSGVSGNIIANNTVTGVRYYYPAIIDGNINDTVGNNVGTLFHGTWTPIDLSGATLSFTNVVAKYIRTADTVTVWGELTYPNTANANGATIGGLPFAPQTGMVGAACSVLTDQATVQNIRLVPSNTYFYLTNTSDVQQTNAACSTHYFKFSMTYLV
jgi:hypothetical protein